MTYVWDTNILLNMIRDVSFFEKLDEKYHFSNPQNESFISAVSVGEIRSLAFRNRWGEKRLKILNQYLVRLKTIAVTDEEDLIAMYCEIDAYSQNQHPSLKLPISARNMGKNDL